jgi:RNA polymerase sigma factor (TIGR02999 family)
LDASVQLLFERLRTGDDSARIELTPTLYKELHRIASRHLRSERPGHTLQATALVHEAYLKLFEGTARQFTDKVHFLAVASRVMRQVLVDYARARTRLKRSPGVSGDTTPRSTSLEVKIGKGVDLLEVIE